MELTKRLLENLLTDLVPEFRRKLEVTLPDVRLSYITKDEFLASAKQNPMIQRMDQLGVFKSTPFEDVYPNFLLVYDRNKAFLEMRALLGTPAHISICFEIAKEKMKPFNKDEVKHFFRHAFAHELTHIVEDELMGREHFQPWMSAHTEAKGDMDAEKELLAENVANWFSHEGVYEYVNNFLWHRFTRLLQKHIKEVRRIE